MIRKLYHLIGGQLNHVPGKAQKDQKDLSQLELIHRDLLCSSGMELIQMNSPLTVRWGSTWTVTHLILMVRILGTPKYSVTTLVIGAGIEVDYVGPR